MSDEPLIEAESLFRAARLLGRPWTMLVIASLLDQPRRFTEIVAALPGISTNLLTERLRVLGESGLITRTPTPTSSTYALTAQGEALGPILIDLTAWGASLSTSRPS